MTAAFVKDASITLDVVPAGESAVVDFVSLTDVRVRYVLRDAEGRPYTVKDIDFLAFTSSFTPEERSTLLAELRAAAADSAGFSPSP